jgi:hypothetical protein
MMFLVTAVLMSQLSGIVSQTTPVYTLLGVVGTRERLRELLVSCRRRAFTANSSRASVLPFARREEIKWSLAVVIRVTPFGVTPNLGRVDQLIEQMISLGMISLIDQ